MITAINCPNRQTDINVNNWFENFAKTDNGLYYFKCLNCKEKLGSTLTIYGTLAIWCKEKEEK